MNIGKRPDLILFIFSFGNMDPLDMMQINVFSFVLEIIDIKPLMLDI